MTREEVFSYIKTTYKTEPDYPFNRDFDSAVLRHKGTDKWFALVMKVRADKLGYDSEELIDIITLKSDPALIDTLISKQNYHRAYHMNKTQWMSVELNHQTNADELKNLIDLSFTLTDKKCNKYKKHKKQ